MRPVQYGEFAKSGGEVGGRKPVRKVTRQRQALGAEADACLTALLHMYYSDTMDKGVLATPYSETLSPPSTVK